MTEAGAGSEGPFEVGVQPPMHSSGNVPAPALELAGIEVRRGKQSVLKDLSVTVAPGTSVAITGASGSGKSTLLSAILGLVPVQSGRITVAGRQVTGARSRKLAAIRRDDVGVVFQDGYLLSELSPQENVMLAGLLAGMPADAARQRSVELLAGLGVPDGSRSVDEFSGGERQRVAVARALINSPAVILADEPTGSLDPHNRDIVSSTLFDVPGQFGCALIVVTHDPLVSVRADQRLVLVDGRLVQPRLRQMEVAAL